MLPIKDLSELKRWVELSTDDVSLPFETSLGASLKYLAFVDYAALFTPEVMKAVGHWSRQNGLRRFAMFFTIPDPLQYFDKSGFYGLTATGDDEASEVEEFLTDGNRWKGFFSVYDASHRFIVIPEGRSWMFIGDRDADLAILGFKTEEERQRFVDGAAIVMFDSLTDAAAHAKSFMSYTLDTAVLTPA
jgi:hypothetical protein